MDGEGCGPECELLANCLTRPMWNRLDEIIDEYLSSVRPGSAGWEVLTLRRKWKGLTDMRVYADQAATTSLSKTALEAMLPWMTENFGNPVRPV